MLIKEVVAIHSSNMTYISRVSIIPNATFAYLLIFSFVLLTQTSNVTPFSLSYGLKDLAPMVERERVERSLQNPKFCRLPLTYLSMKTRQIFSINSNKAKLISKIAVSVY